MPKPGTLVFFLAAALSLAVAPGRAEPPRLVVLVAIDQLRPDRIGPELAGGLGRLTREGRVYVEAALDHALTETCAGHATMLTGRHPGATGLVGNELVDLEAGRRIYCAEDPSEGARVLGAPGGRSPRNLRVTALGDWMKQADPRTRVFSVSGKDRAAIALGGKHPDAAYWFSETRTVGFTSSRYYLDELPAWVRAFNGEDPPRDGCLAGLPERWEHDAAATRGAPRPDDFEGEATDLSRVSPHPLRDPDLEKFAEQLFASPYIDEITLDFATALVRHEKLGRGPAPDLLGVSLSATDIVGHRYGPFSHESRDALVRLDAALGRFLGFLEQEVGSGRLLVVLTSDHGVLPLPEWLAANGESQCPVDGGRAPLRRMGLGLLWHLHWKLGPLSRPRSWLVFAGSQVAVKRPLARERGVEVEKAVALARAYLEDQPAIARVWTRAEIENGTEGVARLYRNSYDPERSGDLVVQVAPTCIISAYGAGTTHGSPYLYDRAVPLVFFGPDIASARIRGPAATVDIAPTLARRLGIPAPRDLDGRVLFE